MRLVILIFLLTFTLVSIRAQTQLLKGKVVDTESGNGVPFASISMINKNAGIGAKENGAFEFRVSQNDTLEITSIGYKPLQYIIDLKETDFNRQILFKLDPTVYDLDSIQVIQLTNGFYLKKPTFDTLDLGFYNPSIIRDWDKMQTLPVGNGEAGMVITGFLNAFDKDLQQRKILRKIRQAEAFKKERQAEREKYFNKDLVKRVTRIDDRVIDEFMEYCNFLDGQIIGKTEYEVTLLILEKYKTFLWR